MISGEVGVIKPDPRIFERLLHRFGVDARDSVFVDDSAANVAAAERLGFHAVRFTDPAALRVELVGLGLLPREQRA